jgi:phosphatidylserine decarboxylase
LGVAKEGYPFIVAAAGLALVAFAAGWWWGGSGFGLLAALFLGFFRDPRRVSPQENGLIVSPADGRLVKVTEREDQKSSGERGTRLSIFLSPLDVHINRAPVKGRVEEVEYRKGRFFAAYTEKASENERNSLKIVDPRGEKVRVVQVAGFLARRIVCYVKPGDQLEIGQKFGMIMFGSRVDLLLPEGARIEVTEGQRVRGGETVIGRLP